MHCPDRGRTPGLCLCLSRQRALWFAVLSGLWGLVIVARMAQFMILQRGEYVEQMDRESWHRGLVPAQRGRLLDASGRPLAWSVRRLRLEWRIPTERAKADEQWQALCNLQGLVVRLKGDDYLRFMGANCVAADDISGDRAAAVNGLCSRYETMSIVPYFVRHRAGSYPTRRALGKVLQKGGMEVGIDGFEREHDGLLRGRPGIFLVMLDKDGNWMMDTWKEIQKMQPGYDVILPLREPEP